MYIEISRSVYSPSQRRASSGPSRRPPRHFQRGDCSCQARARCRDRHQGSCRLRHTRTQIHRSVYDRFVIICRFWVNRELKRKEGKRGLKVLHTIETSTERVIATKVEIPCLGGQRECDQKSNKERAFEHRLSCYLFSKVQK